MKLLLINPRLPENFWNFSWVLREVTCDKKGILTPLGLATLAALTPEDWDITLIDETVEPIPWDFQADVVGVCGMAVQYPRQIEIVEHFRQQGAYVVVGGSYASLCPEQYTGIANTVVAGEAEYIWPQFCREFQQGCAQALYRETGVVELTDSPPPRYDLLKLERYQTVALQFSRGCPFRCEFCDIIVTFGRKPRTKNLEQIERELDLLRAKNIRSVFFVDDNLIGHLPKCQTLLRFLADYQEKHHYHFSFGAETSANVATWPDLLGLLRQANFQWVFVGIETPSFEALNEVSKGQNTRNDLLASLQTIYAAGLDVYASFIVGFDADDSTIFERQYRFLLESGIIVASIGLLLALPKTPLYERLQREGRLYAQAGKPHQLWNNLIATNVIPKKMTTQELTDGFRILLSKACTDGAIAQRIRNKLRYISSPLVPFRLTERLALVYLCRFLIKGIAFGGPKRWYHFVRSLAPAFLQPRLFPFVVLNWTYGLAIQAFVKVHVETVEERK